MSYARIDDNCDVYLYYSVTGKYTLHTKRYDIVPNPEYKPHLAKNILNNWPDMQSESKLYLAGETFLFDKAEDVQQKLWDLMNYGYKIPDHTLDRINNEVVRESWSQKYRAIYLNQAQIY